MGRFSRRRDVDGSWVAGLPDEFSLDELTSRTTSSEDLRRALSWLYVQIERGRIEPEQTADGMRYRLLARRADDEPGRPGSAGTDVSSTSGGR
jgi:hypothetical protein